MVISMMETEKTTCSSKPCIYVTVCCLRSDGHAPTSAGGIGPQLEKFTIPFNKNMTQIPRWAEPNTKSHEHSSNSDCGGISVSQVAE
jgi:hypothetical protein